MTRAGRGVCASLALLACGGLTSFAPHAGTKRIAPFRTTLAVRWGGGAGSDAFLDDLSRSMAERIARSCFSGVIVADRDPAEPATDLAFTVVLSEVVDETRFEDSIASTLQPGEPAKELRRVARFAVTVDATLSARASGALIHRKRLVADVSRRPIYVGEDPQAQARAEVIEDIVDHLTRALGCGAAKLERRIRDALGIAAPSAAAPR